MRVLLTRLREDAELLAGRLAERQIESLVEPMLTLVPVGGGAIDLTQVQALVFTSANGARSFTARQPERRLPVFAVGDATAAVARRLGFIRVESAAGDVEDLARLIPMRLTPGDGALFHGAGRQVAGDLKGKLERAGFTVIRRTLYEAQPVESLSSATQAALTSGTAEAAAFFSPRTAMTFVRLVEGLGLKPAIASCHAVCLSQAVASEIAQLSWAGIRVAERPTQDALIEELTALQIDLAGAARQIGVKNGRATGTSMADDETQESPPDEADRELQPALRVIAAFGGIRPMAGKLDIAVSTVQGWREREVIPAGRHDEIVETAERLGIAVDQDLIRASGDRTPTAGLDSDQAPSEAQAEGSQGEGDGPDAGQDSSAVEETDASPMVEEPEGEGAEAEEPEAEEPKAEEPEAARPETAPSWQAETPPPIPPGPTPSAPVPSDLPPKRSGGRGGGMLLGFILALLLLVGGGAAAVVTHDIWQPLIGGGGGEDESQALLQAVEGQLTALRGELGELGADVSRLNSRVEEEAAKQPAASADTQSDALSVVSAEIEDLGARLGTIEELAVSLGQSEGTAAPALDAELGERLTEIEAQLNSLAERETAGTGDSGLGDRLTQLETDLGQMASLTERQSDLADRFATTSARLDEIEAAADEPAPTGPESAATTGDVALMLAVDRLEEATGSADSFAPQLETVASLLGGAEGTAEPLAALSAQAASGAPTREQLRRSFPPTARAIVAAAAGADNEGWTGQVMRSLAGIVTLRRTGEVTGEGVDAIVARAEVRAAEGNLAGALAQLDALTGRAAAAAAGWRSGAESRLAVEGALASLTEQIIAQIAPTGN